MIKKFGALKDVDKLIKRFEGIFGEKTVNKFLDKRKGLGPTRASKIGKYAWKKPDSTKRRVKRINTALDVAPYAATGAGAIGVMSMMSGDKNNKKG
jgi:hypothetical protein|tara:strand:+ start:232 stop:519 length:288 start_codon:yes stop_codon:yes gene_type:complete